MEKKISSKKRSYGKKLNFGKSNQNLGTTNFMKNAAETGNFNFDNQVQNSSLTFQGENSNRATSGKENSDVENSFEKFDQFLADSSENCDTNDYYFGHEVLMEEADVNIEEIKEAEELLLNFNQRKKNEKKYFEELIIFIKGKNWSENKKKMEKKIKDCERKIKKLKKKSQKFGTSSSEEEKKKREEKFSEILSDENSEIFGENSFKKSTRKLSANSKLSNGMARQQKMKLEEKYEKKIQNLENELGAQKNAYRKLMDDLNEMRQENIKAKVGGGKKLKKRALKAEEEKRKLLEMINELNEKAKELNGENND